MRLYMPRIIKHVETRCSRLLYWEYLASNGLKQKQILPKKGDACNASLHATYNQACRDAMLASPLLGIPRIKRPKAETDPAEKRRRMQCVSTSHA